MEEKDCGLAVTVDGAGLGIIPPSEEDAEDEDDKVGEEASSRCCWLVLAFAVTTLFIFTFAP